MGKKPKGHLPKNDYNKTPNSEYTCRDKKQDKESGTRLKIKALFKTRKIIIAQSCEQDFSVGFFLSLKLGEVNDFYFRHFMGGGEGCAKLTVLFN